MIQMVKILVDEDGVKQLDPQWHLVVEFGDSQRALCTGEVFGDGEGSAKYKTKYVKRMGKACPNCINQVKWFQLIKL